MIRFVLAALIAAASPALAAADRLFVLDCGAAHAPDQSRWSPGVNAGQPIDIVDNCYLIHDGAGYLLWDTGVPDALFGQTQPGPGPIPWRRDKTLAGQLQAIGVQPADITYVGISHTHGDHVGNVELFPAATVLIQKAEYDWAFASATKPFSATHPVDRLDGEKDVFGDGSVRIIPTPGHTPGHESLLVHLPKTGWIILSGDVAHFRDNYDNRRVPGGNTDKAASLASMQHVSELIEEYHAQFWINHDAKQAAGIRHAPEYYE
jgi:glyoxylase-like metal-dependent hydrolase (beta-lactamase superfamily II)